MADSEPLLVTDMNPTMEDINANAESEHQAQPEGKKPTNWWRRTVGLVWDSVEGDARNRRYVQKLDTFLL